MSSNKVKVYMRCPRARKGECRADDCHHFGVHKQIVRPALDACKEPPRNTECPVCVSATQAEVKHASKRD